MLGQTLYILHNRNQPKGKFWRFPSAQVKIYQIVVILKQQISFSSNFASLFSAMRLFSTFLAEILYTFNKRSLSKCKFDEISREQSKVWNFPLWCAPNYIKFQLKRSEELSLVTLKSDAKFKGKLTFGFKYGMNNLVNFHPTTQKFENFTSISFFCPKYIKFELKNTE